MFTNRKASYKLPPTTIRDKLISQETRRAKALQDQKRKRAQRVDSNRQLELFADLTLAESDNEDDDDAEATFTPGSVAAYASMVEPSQPPNAISGTLSNNPPTEEAKQDTSAKKKRRRKKGKNKNARWADQCMYAELLEMSEDDPWADVDGLPEDLEVGWVAVAPVPVGKRCLAIAHQSAGIAGVVPNTTLRSRLLGKILIQRFPSNLPPLTVLDCILDINWRENGILHVLDVIKWKGQDICDCEAPFRFWWRDTRLAELASLSPPTPNPNSNSKSQPQDRYTFPYPTRILPIPYHADTSLPTLYHQIIPSARSNRSLNIQVPVPQIVTEKQFESGHHSGDNGMEMETSITSNVSSGMFGITSNPSTTTTKLLETTIRSDGLLLYVSSASYESGTSPLSSWIPIISYDESKPEHEIIPSNGPLQTFERLVQRRMQKKNQNLLRSQSVEVEMG